jgi:glycosyltransferase involved in cell wall biosynthesis
LVLSRLASNGDAVIPGLVTIIIPAYNEKDTVEELVHRVAALEIEKQVLLVDDGSVDGTREIVRRLGAQNGACALLVPRNQGKGAAFRLGLEYARGEVVIIQDADLEYDPAEIPKVVAPILSGTADVCYGSRIRGPNRERSSLAFYWGGRLLSWLTTCLYGVHVTDGSTGYKAFRTESLRQIPLKGKRFELEAELTGKAILRGCAIRKLPSPTIRGKSVKARKSSGETV